MLDRNKRKALDSLKIKKDNQAFDKSRVTQINLKTAYELGWFYVLFLEFVYLNSVRNEVENYNEVNEVKLV